MNWIKPKIKHLTFTIHSHLQNIEKSTTHIHFQTQLQNKPKSELNPQQAIPLKSDSLPSTLPWSKPTTIVTKSELCSYKGLEQVHEGEESQSW